MKELADKANQVMAALADAGAAAHELPDMIAENFPIEGVGARVALGQVRSELAVAGASLSEARSHYDRVAQLLGALAASEESVDEPAA